MTRVHEIEQFVENLPVHFPDGVNPVQENVTIVNAIKFLTETIQRYDTRN